jgi:hypothetical protein
MVYHFRVSGPPEESGVAGDERDLVSAKEASTILECSPSTVREYRRCGDLAGVRKSPSSRNKRPRYMYQRRNVLELRARLRRQLAAAASKRSDS